MNRFLSAPHRRSQRVFRLVDPTTGSRLFTLDGMTNSCPTGLCCGPRRPARPTGRHQVAPTCSQTWGHPPAEHRNQSAATGVVSGRPASRASATAIGRNGPSTRPTAGSNRRAAGRSPTAGIATECARRCSSSKAGPARAPTAPGSTTRSNPKSCRPTGGHHRNHHRERKIRRSDQHSTSTYTVFAVTVVTMSCIAPGAPESIRE